MVWCNARMSIKAEIMARVRSTMCSLSLKLCSFIWRASHPEHTTEKQAKPCFREGVKSTHSGAGACNLLKLATVVNTSLAAPGALAHCLQCRTACNTAEANLHSPNQKTEVISLQ